MFVLPSPFKTLFKVVFKYKNGQIQARTVKNLPAIELENMNFPRKFPNNKKNIRQRHPKRIQKVKVFLIAVFNLFSSPAAWDSETAGSSIKAMEPVSAFGKRIKGRAIPFKIP